MRARLICGLSLMWIAGCQTVPYQGQARNVKLKKGAEGIISIPADYRQEDRSKADQVMSANCNPGRPDVLEEGEVAVGTKTDSKSKDTDRKDGQHQAGSLFGIPIIAGEAGGKDTSSSSTTTQLKEWHISYRCLKDKQKTSVQ